VASATTPQACPICGGTVERLGLDFWRCIDHAAHYWEWRGEKNSGAIRKFLTQPHEAKLGAFYEMSASQRERLLVEAAQRMHTDGYTPHGGGGSQ
jgi:hypothetical protein